MGTLIKIDRNSIKKNKDAGRTSTYIPGVETITFEGECSQGEIDRLEKERGIYIGKITHDNSKLKKITGNLDHAGLIDLLPNGFIIESSTNMQILSHLPIPEYSFKYENTVLQCCECLNMVHRKDIQRDETVNEDLDEYSFDVCPICKEPNSFSYEYESIDHALITK